MGILGCPTLLYLQRARATQYRDTNPAPMSVLYQYLPHVPHSRARKF